MGVDQRSVQLTAPVPGLLTQVDADDVMQHHSVGILLVVTDRANSARRWQ
jgi:hypothetical protein